MVQETALQKMLSGVVELKTEMALKGLGERTLQGILHKLDEIL